MASISLIGCAKTNVVEPESEVVMEETEVTEEPDIEEVVEESLVEESDIDEAIVTETTVDTEAEETIEESEEVANVTISAEEAEKVICETTKKWVDYQDKSWKGEIDNYIYILACINDSLRYHNLKDFNERGLYNSYYKSGPDDPWPWERQFACAAYAVFNEESTFDIDHYYNDILKGWYEINGASVYYDLGGDIVITNIIYPGTESLKFDGLIADCEVYFTQEWELESDSDYHVMNHKKYIAYFSSTIDENGSLTWNLLDIKYE